MVPEAPLEQTEDGLLPAGEGWFVLNAREAAWRRREGMGKWPRLEGATPMFPQLGVGITVLEPGEPMTMYHWETDQENFRGAYRVDETAVRHGAGVEEETDDADVAYGRLSERVSTRYRDGWLPG